MASAVLAFAMAAPCRAGEAQGAAPRQVAVLYSETDDRAASFAGIIDGMEQNGDVVVVRIAVADAALHLAATSERLRSGLKLALAGEASGIAVLYPDIGEPYRSVFSKIIEGIEDTAKKRVASYAVNANSSARELTAELRRREIGVVIALGRNGLKAAAGLDRDIGVIGGGVVSISEADAAEMKVLSLAPDPALLFARLKILLPGVRRIFVVHDPRQSAWLIRLAREAARRHGFLLEVREAYDLKSAVRQYQEIIALVDPKKDALWLPQDTTAVEDSAVMPLVLQESWNRVLPVFSSNVAHVRRGVLFSLYPNNMELGRNLANSALGHLTSSSATRPGITPLREVLAAINTRTAGHLGLDLGRQPQGFDLLLPEQ